MCYFPLQIVHAYRSERAQIGAILLWRELRYCFYNQRQQPLSIYCFSCHVRFIPFPEHFGSPALLLHAVDSRMVMRKSLFSVTIGTFPGKQRC